MRFLNSIHLLGPLWMDNPETQIFHGTVVRRGKTEKVKFYEVKTYLKEATEQILWRNVAVFRAPRLAEE